MVCGTFAYSFEVQLNGLACLLNRVVLGSGSPLRCRLLLFCESIVPLGPTLSLPFTKHSGSLARMTSGGALDSSPSSMIPPPRRLGPESRGSGEGVLGHSFLLPPLLHLHQLRSSSAMTDADSWDTCVLGYMCTRSILLAKDSSSPSPLNRPVEQAGGEAVWRGSASRRQPGAEAQSGFPIRGLPCSLGAPGPRVPSLPVAPPPPRDQVSLPQEGC